MLTIAGTGMTNYCLNGLFKLIDLKSFDVILLDKNYIDNENNKALLANANAEIISGGFSTVKGWLIDHYRTNATKKLLYIVTGNPNFYSGATVLISLLKNKLLLGDDEITVVSNQSCKDYILSRLGIPEHSLSVLTLHARDYPDLSQFLAKEYSLIICDRESLRKCYEALFYLDPENYEITIASKLGYSDEAFINTRDLKSFVEKQNIDALMPYTLLIKKKYCDPSPYDDLEQFHHDSGMITKKLKRGLILHELELFPNQLLWDVGAASGSVGISAFKSHHIRTAYFEKNAKRVGNLIRNLKEHHVLSAKVLYGNAFDLAKAESEHPDRIFIGGGGSEIATNIDSFYDWLNDGGLLVAVYVTLTYLTAAIETLRKCRIPFSVKTISLTDFKQNDMIMSEPERLMFLIKIRKDKNE